MRHLHRSLFTCIFYARPISKMLNAQLQSRIASIDLENILKKKSKMQILIF